MLWKFALLSLLACCYATPPPGYVKPPEVDKYPPKYEYGYTIQDNRGSGQGKLESREGIFSLGRYFVQLGGPKGASQNVEYITDEWGYHPLVEYSSIGDYSTTSTQFALGQKAVDALRNNFQNQNPVKDSQNKGHQSIQSPSPTQSTTIPVKTVTPTPSQSPVYFQQTPVSTPQPKSSKTHSTAQKNLQAPQNSIPYQYILPFNLPQTQYLFQPKYEQLPQPQFLIQPQNVPQTQFYIPLYDTSLENTLQVHQVSINLSPTQQPNNNQQKYLQESNRNIGSERQNVQQPNNNQLKYLQETHRNIDSDRQTVLQQGNNNIELKKNTVTSNQVDEKQIRVVVHDNQQLKQTNINNAKQETEEQINNGYNQQIDNNKKQYLVEQKQPQQNLVLLSSQNDEIVVPNSGQNAETSTAKYNEQLKHDQEEVKYLAQAIQNDLSLQNTESLFANNANEVRYSSNRNSNRFREENSYDESALDLENAGGYGSRIKYKKPNSIQSNYDVGTRLIDRTRNLVTGMDVLNINDAISNYVADNQSDQQNRNIIAEYSSGNVQYGYNENVPNTILEVVSNLSTRNIMNSNQDQKVISDYNNDQQSSNENDSSDGTHQQSNLITSSSSYSSKINSIQNSRTKLLEILNSEKVQNKSEDKSISFADQPIVVAELENHQDNVVQSTTQNYKEEKNIAETIYSTTQNTVETKITEDNLISTVSPVLITPRPVSNAFLAPITAAVSLQNSASDLENFLKDYAPETSVEIQKSIPYYLGKVEFLESLENLSSHQSLEEEPLSTKLIIQRPDNDTESSKEEVGSQEAASSQEHVVSQENSDDKPKAEALISNKGQNGLNNDGKATNEETNQESTSAQQFKQFLDFDTPTAEAEESKIVNKPVELSKIIDRPYPIEIPIGLPYPVEKQVPIEVEKVVEKPVHITKVVEKPVPIHIPRPYPVEVEKIVEKQVKVPVEVTRYVNHPYPIHIPYPEPIAIPVEVEKLVRTIVKEPYPVEVPVRVEVPVKVPVPKPVTITKYIEKPYPVEKIVEKPVTVEKIIEKPVTKYIHVPVPHPIAIPVEIKVPQPYPVEITKYIDKPYGIAQAHSSPVPKTVKPHNHQQIQIKHPITKLVQIPVELPKYHEKQVPVYVNFHQHNKQNPYLYAPKYQVDWKDLVNCELNHKYKNNHNQHRFAGKTQEYIGLVPPLAPQNLGHINPNYKRKARNSFVQNLRIEYGFKPPIVPSIQTDEYGMPLEKEE